MYSVIFYRGGPEPDGQGRRTLGRRLGRSRKEFFGSEMGRCCMVYLGWSVLGQRCCLWKGEVLGIINSEIIMPCIFHQFLYLSQPKLGKFGASQRPDHSPLIN